MYCGVYNIYKSKTYDKNITKTDLKVGCDKLKLYAKHLKQPLK